MMKRTTKLFMMMLALVLSAGLTSCDDVTGAQDNPVTPTPTPTPTPAPTYASDLERPLTFEAAMDGVKVTFKFKSGAKPDYKKVEYSLDQGATWTALKRRSQSILLEKAGDMVMFRGDNPTYNGDARFVTELVNVKARGITRGNTSETPLFNVFGNITSLIERIDFAKKNNLSEINAGCYKFIFKGASIEIVSFDGKSRLVFPAEVLAQFCYEGALAETPIKQGVYLPAPTLVKGSYVDLFRGCSKLEGVTLAANSVEAGTEVYDCVAGMLMDTATDLPADVKPKLTFVEPRPGIENEINVEKRPVQLGDISGSILMEEATNPDVADRLSGWDVVFIDENGNEQQVEPGIEQQVEPAISEEGKQEEVDVEDPCIGVNSVSIDQKTLSLEIGATATLIAIITPDNAPIKSITWTSKDTKIATVTAGSDGKATVTAVAAGSTKIELTVVPTYSFSGGTWINPTCLVTVTEPEPEPEPEPENPVIDSTDDFVEGGDPLK